MPLTLSGTSGVLDNSGAFVRGTSANASGTSVTFTGIPSWAKRVILVIGGVSTNGGAIPLVRVGSGSISSSGYVSGGTGLQAAALISSVNTTGIPMGGDNGSGYVLIGRVVFENISGNTWVASGVGGGTNNGGANNRTWLNGGTITLGGSLDRIQYTTTNGTDSFTAGTLNVLYE